MLMYFLDFSTARLTPQSVAWYFSKSEKCEMEIQLLFEYLTSTWKKHVNET